MKLIKIIVSFIFILSLTSCANNNSQQNSSTDLDEVASWIEEQINPYVIDGNLVLPTKYLDTDIEISWTSSNERIMTNEGKILKRDATNVSEITLFYSISDQENSKSGSIDVHVYPRTFDYVSNQFKVQFPDKIYESLENIYPDIVKNYNVTWTSSNPEIFSNEGIYTQPAEDTLITINYRVNVTEEIYKDYSFDVLVVVVSDDKKINLVSSWIENEIIPDLNVSEDIALPTTHPILGTTISWTTSDENIISEDGTVTRYVFDRYVELSCTIEYESKILQKNYWFTVKALDTTKMTEEEILTNFISAIAVDEISQVYFSEYTDITQSFNTLKFFDNEWKEQIEWIAPIENNNRPGTKISKVEFVLVHDTANNNKNAAGEAHAVYVENGGGGTSFQYTVGNDGIYHLIPNDEVAYHAGDGTSTAFKLSDTGVKATGERPHVTIDESGYFAFNGVVGNIKIPSDATIHSQIVPSGLIVEVGPNGNYWLNANYYNKSFGYISNFGGNLNSIGIETCVDQGSDYHKTLRYNTDLVARLLIENNLDVCRVIQHNNTAGKYCPAAMITENYWQIFRDAVSLEKFGMENFEGLTFEWTSHSDILTDDGYISLKVGEAKEVSYSVVVKRGEEVVYQQTFTTKIVK